MKSHTKNMPKKSQIIVFSLITFFIMVFNFTSAHAAKTNQIQSPTLVVVTPAKSQKFNKQITVTGSLRAKQGVMVRPEVNGRITQIYFNSGDIVTAGAPLIQLNPAIAAAQLAQSKANLALEKLNYGRSALLNKTHAIAQSDFDLASSKFTTAEAKVDQDQASLDQTLIKAPFSGKLGLSAVNLGDYLKAGQDIVKLESIDPIEVEFSVPEIYTHQLVVDQTVNITSDANKDQIFTGKIYAIDVTVNLSNRTIMARATIPNKDGKLVSGSFVKVIIDISSSQPSIVIPQIALFYDNGQAYVYKVVNNKALKTKVALGNRDNENVEIVNGLAAGDLVITEGLLNINDGTIVTTNSN